VKNLTTLVLAVALTLTATRSFADEASHRKLAEEVLKLIKAEEQNTKMFEQVKAMQQQNLQALSKSANVPVSPETTAMQNEITDMMAKEMSWDKVKEDYIGVYMQTFTEEELTGLIKFYKTDIGQKFIEKTPELSTKLMKIGQEQAMRLLPQIRQITQAYADKIRQQKAAAAQSSAAPAAGATNAEKK